MYFARVNGQGIWRYYIWKEIRIKWESKRIRSKTDSGRKKNKYKGPKAKISMVCLRNNRPVDRELYMVKSEM